MPFYLTVDETLQNVKEYSYGLCHFTGQKGLNQTIMHIWKNTRNRETVETFIKHYRETSKDFMVIEITEKEHIKTMSTGWDYEKPARAQENFDKIKKDIDLRRIVINSFNHYLEIALRRVLIQDYFVRNIAPKISPAAILAEEKAGYKLTYHLRNSGWGYIAAFRHKVVMEFVDRPCYWVKLLHSANSLELVHQNLTKNKDNRIFLDKPDAIVRYIDIFTSDEDSAHLLALIADDEMKAFNVNLSPLFDELKRLNLFYAIAEYEKQQEEESVVIQYVP